MTKHPIFQILALQAVFAMIMGIAIVMGTKADNRCKPSPPPELKDCHPAPEIGHGAMSCTWPSGPPVNPWAPTRRCEER
jgi:hypothetical protein